MAEEKGTYVVDGKSIDSNSTREEEVFNVADIDTALAKKTAAINDAIDGIGLTGFHWKLFCLNGFGYAVDSMLTVLAGNTQPLVELELKNPNKKLKGISLASTIGLLAGALFWGFTADIIGRRLAFNLTLFIAAAAIIIAGAMPTYLSFSAFTSIAGFAAGGNYLLDSTIFLEFCPSRRTWLVTMLATWWAIGYIVSGMVAWGFLANYSCPVPAPKSKVKPKPCLRSMNMGWRYLHFTIGALVFVLSLLRITVLRLPHSTKWLIAQGRDAEAVEVLQKIATKYNRPFNLTTEQLQSYGQIHDVEKSAWSVRRVSAHVRELFKTRKLAYSTVMLWFTWAIVGLVHPLFHVFLPYYLYSRGYKAGVSSNYLTWRNYAITQLCGLFGPPLAAYLVTTKYLGRRGTLAVTALVTMLFQFGYTQVKTPQQNLGVVSAMTIFSIGFYATLYAYTPEILPSAHRATGYGLAVGVNRFMGVIAIIIASYSDVTSTAPLFICASLKLLLAITSLLLPLEPRGKKAA